MAAASTIIAGTAAAATVGGTVMQGLSGPEQESGRFRFSTLEQELSVLNDMKSNYTNIQNNYRNVVSARDALQKKVELFDKASSNQIAPMKMQRELAMQNMRIAIGMGKNAEELVANKFLTQDEVNMFNAEKSLDPTLENKLSEQKAQLLQQMRRDGASPQIIAQAMSRFESAARQERFSSNVAMAQAKSGARMQNFEMLANILGLNKQELERNINLSVGRMQAQQGLLQANQSVMQSSQEMQQSRLQQAEFEGNLDISKRAQIAIDQGLTGIEQTRKQTAPFLGGKKGVSSYQLRDWETARVNIANARDINEKGFVSEEDKKKRERDLIKHYSGL